MQSNPYSPPGASAGGDRGPDDDRALLYPRASLSQRFFNNLIDTLVFFGIVMTVGVALALSAGALGASADSVFADGGLFNLVSYAIFLLYYFGLEAATGRTVGKLITGTRVVRLGDCGRAPISAILLRSLIRFVPFDGLSIFFKAEELLTWHDKWSRTMVVNLREPGLAPLPDEMPPPNPYARDPQ